MTVDVVVERAVLFAGRLVLVDEGGQVGVRPDRRLQEAAIAAAQRGEPGRVPDPSGRHAG